MEPISHAFVEAIDRFAREHKVEVVQFRKGERKDDIAAGYLKAFRGDEGVLFIGKAQEKTPVLRTERRRNAKTGANYPWLVRSTAMVNHFYVYAVGRDFGPFFVKFCSYFPYNAKLCLNGHEWLKRQLSLRDIAYEALDKRNIVLRAAGAGSSAPPGALGRQDRCAAAQVVASPAAPVYPGGPSGGLPL